MGIEKARKAKHSDADNVHQSCSVPVFPARSLPAWIALSAIGIVSLITVGCSQALSGCNHLYFQARPIRAGVDVATETTGTLSSAPILKFQGNQTVIGDPAGYGVGLRREADCTITEYFTQPGGTSYLSGTLGLTTVPNFQQTLHALAGLTTRGGVYAGGCRDAELGIVPRYGTFLGLTKDGSSGVGAYIDYNNNLFIGSVNSSTGKYTATEALTGNALSLLAADVNGDGLPDLLVQTFTTSGNTTVTPISIYINKGDGTFKAPVTVTNTRSAGAGGWTVDDFTGDGKADLVFSVFDTGVVFLKGNGNGTFGAPVTTKLTATSQYMSSGDFNGDKKKDLVLGNGMILLGNGEGSFTQGTTIALPGGQSTAFQAPVVGDWNNDGRQDLAFEAAGTGGGMVNIFLGKGDGTFIQGKSYAIIGGTFYLSAADLDGDGNQDLIVGEGNGGVFGPDWNSGGFFQALMGRGDGTFASAEAFFGPKSFVVGNFRSSKINDLLVTNTAGVQLYENNGKGEFTPGASIDAPGAFNAAAADMNGDGKLDAVFGEVNEGTYEIAVALGSGDGTFDTPVTYPLSSSIQFGSTVHFSLADLNGDKKPDLLLAVNGDLYVMMNDGKGNLGGPVQVASEPHTILGIVTADFNKDGKTDVAFAESTAIQPTSAGAVVVLLGKGNGTFGAQTKLTVNYSPLGIAAADMNNDGNLDLVVTATNKAYTATSLYVLPGKGNGTFGAPIGTALYDAYATSVSVADFDGDGNQDVLVGACCGTTYASIAFGKGNGTFPALYDLTLGGSAAQAEGVDVNGDGKPDVVVASDEVGGFVSVMLNTYPTVVKLAATTTTLKSSSASATYGSAVTLTATVKGKIGATIPTGKVTFLSGKTAIGTATLSKSGVATLETGKLPAGTDSITASYGGSSAFAESVSAAVDVRIAADATTTTLTALPASVSSGSPVTLTAVVKPKTGTAIPAGAVTFLSGKTALGKATLGAKGDAILRISTLAVGTHSITAEYAGNGDFTASTSTAITVKVTAP